MQPTIDNMAVLVSKRVTVIAASMDELGWFQKARVPVLMCFQELQDAQAKSDTRRNTTKSTVLSAPVVMWLPCELASSVF